MWESQAAFWADFSKRLREATLLVAFRRRGISTAGPIVWSPPGPPQFLTHIAAHPQLRIHLHHPTVIAQNHRRVTPREPAQLHKLVQDGCLLFLPPSPVPSCRGLCDPLSLFHR